MDDNYIVKSFVKMKITELKNELKVANRNWKSRVQGELKTYEDVQKMLELQDEANKKQPKQVMVVWATDIDKGKKTGSPWIYGAYTDHRKGADIQDKMQNSEDYGYLYWSNNVVLLDKK